MQPASVKTQKKETSIRPKGFALCERLTGTVRFRVQADSDGEMPVDEVASLLATRCLVFGQVLEDFEIMIMPDDSLSLAVAQRAEQLLVAARAIVLDVKITRQERKVLDGVIRNLTNKEIASMLNISVRTVKFHVSSLLAKHGVTNRIELCKEVALGHVPRSAPEGQTADIELVRLSDRPQKGRVREEDTPSARPPATETTKGRDRGPA